MLGLFQALFLVVAGTHCSNNDCGPYDGPGEPCPEGHNCCAFSDTGSPGHYNCACCGAENGQCCYGQGSVVYGCCWANSWCCTEYSCCEYADHDQILLMWNKPKGHLNETKVLLKKIRLGCQEPNGPCDTVDDCCASCTGVSCSNGLCIAGTCLPDGAACSASCECCAECIINDFSPGFCGN